MYRWPAGTTACRAVSDARTCSAKGRQTVSRGSKIDNPLHFSPRKTSARLADHSIINSTSLAESHHDGLISTPAGLDPGANRRYDSGLLLCLAREIRGHGPSGYVFRPDRSPWIIRAGYAMHVISFLSVRQPRDDP